MRTERCPLCGTPSTSAITLHHDGVVTVHHRCAEGHGWLIKWEVA